MDDNKWDKLLGIKTTGRDDTNANQVYYPYEPTSYAVLEKLAKSNYIGKRNTLIDFGCGKFRVGIYLAYETKCKSLGIEVDDRIYKIAEKNVENCCCKTKVDVLLSKAEEVDIDATIDRFFFFNPFSVEILRKVMQNIIASYYENNREIYLFFYYPSDEYYSYLFSIPELTLVEEINCNESLDKQDPREKIAVFKFE